ATALFCGRCRGEVRQDYVSDGGWLIDDVACGSFRYQLSAIDGLQLRRDQPAILLGPTAATHPWRRTALDAPLATYAALFAHLAGERQLEGAEQSQGGARAEIAAAARQASARQTWIASARSVKILIPQMDRMEDR